MREQIAIMAKQLATEVVDPSCLSSYVCCRLLTLNKNPGVRPIGIGEILRRIIGKAVMWTLSSDIEKAAGPLQVSSGVKGGAEAAIHAMHDIFKADGTEGVILVDASNAFNSLNRMVALHNVQYTCPDFATILINTYRTSSRLIISGGREILSEEGTTQGDNLAMAFYGIATITLIENLNRINVDQVWLADDATGAGKLRALFKWLQEIVEEGRKIGYLVNFIKTWLILKNPVNLELAKLIFKDMGIKITIEGKRHLGAVIGSTSFREEYMKEKVSEWCKHIEKLTEFGKSQPHAAFSAYIHAEQHSYTYFLRTIPGMEEQLEPLERKITDCFLPVIFGSAVSETERGLFSLPIKQGGLGIPELTTKAMSDYEISRQINAPLIAIIITQDSIFPDTEVTRKISEGVKAKKTRFMRDKIEEVDTSLLPDTLRAVEQARQTGSSSWLSAIPLSEHGFNMNKKEFQDALALRYNHPIRGLPSQCPCGQKFDVHHALNCKRGGFVISRHNEIRDFEAELLKKVCTDVEVEPPLQPLTGEQLSAGSIKGDEARLDVRARGFWRRGQNAFFDVRITNTNSKSVANVSPDVILKRHEKNKKREYNSRVMNVEQGTFTPLVFSIQGGSAPECSTFHKHLAETISQKTGEQYSKVISFIRCKLSFLILRSAILCIRGSRSIQNKRISQIDNDFGINCFNAGL